MKQALYYPFCYLHTASKHRLWLWQPLTKTAYESITPFWCLFFRFFLAFLIFMLFFGKSIIKQLKSAKILDILPPAFAWHLPISAAT